MEERDGGVLFPVVFYDGEREINIGMVHIYSSLEFKNFQSILSKKIGISPKHMSIYLVNDSRSKSTPQDRRRIPITGKVNFSLVAREKNSSFLVVLKRSRRERRRNQKHSTGEFSDYLPEKNWSPSPEKLLLLRRNQPDLSNSQVSGYTPSFYNPIAPLEFVGYNDRIQNLKIQRQNYLMMNPNTNLNLDMEAFRSIDESYTVPTTKNDRPLCEECTNAKIRGSPATFHWCIYDTVTVGFRSPAGPIARPPKGSVSGFY